VCVCLLFVLVLSLLVFACVCVRMYDTKLVRPELQARGGRGFGGRVCVWVRAYVCGCLFA
jgi:hypothetical protein